MTVRTKVFDLSKKRYKNLSALAEAMGISVSQVYRVQCGERPINQKFIVGAIRAFPNHKLDDLFYLVPDLPTVEGGGRQYQKRTSASSERHQSRRNSDSSAAVLN